MKSSNINLDLDDHFHLWQMLKILFFLDKLPFELK